MMTNREVEVDLYERAEDFWEAAKRCLPAPGSTDAHAATLEAPGIVCLGFAAELFLKCLLLIADNVRGKGHELNVLYAQLDLKTQDRLAQICTKERSRTGRWRMFTPNSGFPSELEWFSVAFLDWRFIQDSPDDRTRAGIEFLVVFARALRAEIQLRRPDLQRAPSGNKTPVYSTTV